MFELQLGTQPQGENEMSLACHYDVYKLTKTCIIGIQDLSTKSHFSVSSDLLSKIIIPKVLLYYLFSIILLYTYFFFLEPAQFSVVLVQQNVQQYEGHVRECSRNKKLGYIQAWGYKFC